MRKKKIAVFSTVWNADYTYTLLEGMKRGARERNADLYLFNTYGDTDKEYEIFRRGEYSIFSLPDLHDFDGALIACNNVGAKSWIDALLDRIHQTGIPIVCVEQEMGAENFIGVDNYGAMYSMVEYLVRDKHCRVLNYVGGPSDNEENILRKKAFVDVLTAYGIPADPRRMQDFTFCWEDGVIAYENFKASGLENPDAVVCANDLMAIGYLRGAADDGLSAPEDFLVTGFDNVSQAMEYSPRITTVNRSREQLGYSSVCYLDDLTERKERPKVVYVPFRLVCSQSTGDPESNRSDEAFRQELFAANDSSRVMRLHLKHLRTALLGNRSSDSFMELMCYYAQLLGIYRFAMGIDAKKIMEFSTKDMLFFGTYNGISIRADWTAGQGLVPRDFLPDDGDSHIFLFSPCHCSGKNFGYCVIIDNFEVIKENLLSEWMLVLDNAAEDLRQSLTLQIMNKKLQELYRKDPMTGLFNRFALDDRGAALITSNRNAGKSTLIVFVDMDSLKDANDQYGHNVGDLALKTIADVIERVADKSLDFAVRYGGDEFLLLGVYPGAAETERIMQTVEKSITALGAERKLPFKLTVSTGYTEMLPDSTETLEAHIKRADHHMYENKVKKRAARES